MTKIDIVDAYGIVHASEQLADLEAAWDAIKKNESYFMATLFDVIEKSFERMRLSLLEDIADKAKCQYRDKTTQ